MISGNGASDSKIGSTLWTNDASAQVTLKFPNGGAVFTGVVAKN